MYDVDKYLYDQTYEEEISELLEQVEEEIQNRMDGEKLEDPMQCIGTSLYFTGTELRILANLLEEVKLNGQDAT